MKASLAARLAEQNGDFVRVEQPRSLGVQRFSSWIIL
jgi:hypothetical protein